MPQSKMPLTLEVIGCTVSVACDDPDISELISECYSAFVVERAGLPDLAFAIEDTDVEDEKRLCFAGSSTLCASAADLLYDFEKTMTQEVQLLRRELYFVHGAAFSSGDLCIVVSGPSGGGKSTLCWRLCNDGFTYLSDELAPILPETNVVEPYPHALCLKDDPPGGPVLPDSTVVTSATMHVPAYELSAMPTGDSRPLTCLVFIDGSWDIPFAMTSISSSEAAARLYANGLNQLAHARDGLSVVSKIAAGVPAFRLTGGSVAERAEAIRKLL